MYVMNYRDKIILLLLEAIFFNFRYNKGTHGSQFFVSYTMTPQIGGIIVAIIQT